MERVTGLESAPADASTYLLKLVRRDHKDVLLPVNSITEKDTIDRKQLHRCPV